MKKIFVLSCVIMAMLITKNVSAQDFITEIEGEGFSSLAGSECIVTLATGEIITGSLFTASSGEGGLSKLTIKLASGEKVKLIAEDVILLKIIASELAKISLITSSSSSIKEAANSNYEEIINREYLIFETAQSAKKGDKFCLLQLLNPGFDSKIKVYACGGGKTMGIGIGQINITGGMDKSYYFVKRGKNTVKVTKGNYKDDFKVLYGDCPEMISYFQGDKIKWSDVATHVFVYDQKCE
jgi:hypothetical protein